MNPFAILDRLIAAGYASIPQLSELLRAHDAQVQARACARRWGTRRGPWRQREVGQ